VSVDLTKQGGGLFKTAVHDWRKELVIPGTFGDCPLRARLLKDGQPLTVRNEAGKSVKEVFALTSLDSTLPDIGAFGVYDKNGDKTLVRGAALRLVVQADDPESGVAKVVFFAGAPTKELKIPENAPMADGELVPLKDSPGGKKTWVAELPVPTDKPGVVDVGVQVTNGAGLQKFGTITIRLVDAPPNTTTPASKLATIEGTVKDKDGRPQPDARVALIDANGKEKDTGKTDAKGKYSFKDLPAGSYKIQASKAAGQQQGDSSVTVSEGQTKSDADVTIGRK